MKFKSLKELKTYIESNVKKALANEVFEAVQELQLEHVQTDVYSVYYPNAYERREADGGLADPSNIQYNLKDTTIYIRNETRFNTVYETVNKGKGLAELIEYGHANGPHGYGYDYPKFDSYTEPRPFIRNTHEELKDNKQHVKALAKGLESQGIKVR